jgi:hypothetical protein
MIMHVLARPISALRDGPCSGIEIAVHYNCLVPLGGGQEGWLERTVFGITGRWRFPKEVVSAACLNVRFLRLLV